MVSGSRRGRRGLRGHCTGTITRSCGTSVGSITPCLRWDRVVHAFSSGDAFGDIISVYLTVLSQIGFSCEYRIMVPEEDLTAPAGPFVAVSNLAKFVTTTSTTWM